MSADSAEERLKSTVFIVEANSFEQLCLWRENSHNSDCRPDGYKPIRWEQGGHGCLITVGKRNTRPVCITVSWANLDGCPVMFWYACSELIDHKLIQKWLKKHFKGTYDHGSRRAECDAMNFSHCISAIGEKNTTQKTNHQ